MISDWKCETIARHLVKSWKKRLTQIPGIDKSLEEYIWNFYWNMVKDKMLNAIASIPTSGGSIFNGEYEPIQRRTTRSDFIVKYNGKKVKCLNEKEIEEADSYIFITLIPGQRFKTRKGTFKTKTIINCSQGPMIGEEQRYQLGAVKTIKRLLHDRDLKSSWYHRPTGALHKKNSYEWEKKFEFNEHKIYSGDPKSEWWNYYWFPVAKNPQRLTIFWINAKHGEVDPHQKDKNGNPVSISGQLKWVIYWSDLYPRHKFILRPELNHLVERGMSVWSCKGHPYGYYEDCELEIEKILEKVCIARNDFWIRKLESGIFEMKQH